MTGNGKTITYKYNDSGIRTQKTVNGVTTTYHLVGDKVTYEENGTDKIYYTYDASDSLVSMNLNGVEYYYIRNAQGDIIGLFDKNGIQVVSYTYDSWGKPFVTDAEKNDATDIIKDGITGSDASTVGVKNPYRYRGYRYDTETSLYYLQSRYYNADWGRFVNADTLVGKMGVLLSHNMFAYCMNDPVNMVDPNGHMSTRTKWIIGAVVVVALVLLAPEVVLATTIEGAAMLRSAAMGITAIANKYGNLKCTNTAVDIIKYLKNLGLKGEQITIKYERNFIWSNTSDKVISENGFHTGILFNGKVYDNIHKAGVTLEKWLADFEGVGNRVIKRTKF